MDLYRLAQGTSPAKRKALLDRVATAVRRAQEGPERHFIQEPDDHMLTLMADWTRTQREQFAAAREVR